MDPRLAEIEVTLLAGYDRVHWIPTGPEPAAELRFRFRETAPFDPCVPRDAASESACAKAARAGSSTAIAKTTATMPFVRRFLMLIRNKTIEF